MLKKQLMTFEKNLIFASTFLFLSCATHSKNQDQPSTQQSVTELQTKVTQLDSDNLEFKKNMETMQSHLDSQNEEILTLKKNIQILKRGFRSGVFEELPEDSVQIKKENQKSPKLPNLVPSRPNMDKIDSTKIDTNEITKETENTPIGPKEILAQAEINYSQSHFKEAIDHINELKNKFPNFDDAGRSFLLAAESMIKIKEFHNAIPEIRHFYLKYPSSADISYAKLLEGQANEGIGNFERAATLYQEVIRLSPQSDLASNAKNGLLRMRDKN